MTWAARVVVAFFSDERVKKLCSLVSRPHPPPTTLSTGVDRLGRGWTPTSRFSFDRFKANVKALHDVIGGSLDRDHCTPHHVLTASCLESFFFPSFEKPCTHAPKQKKRRGPPSLRVKYISRSLTTFCSSSVPLAGPPHRRRRIPPHPIIFLPPAAAAAAPSPACKRRCRRPPSWRAPPACPAPTSWQRSTARGTRRGRPRRACAPTGAA